ncbi:MAG: cupin-like domain-containing protein [Bacteroidota bacterium]
MTNLNYWYAYLLRYYTGREWAKNKVTRAEMRLLKSSKRYMDGEVQEIERIPYNSISIDDFRKNYLNKNKPVVLEGFGNGWPALEKWDIDFFSDNYGEEMIPMRINASVIGENKIEFVKTKFKNFVKDLNDGKDVYASSIENIANNNPELRSDLSIKQLSEYTHMRKNRRILSTQFFISNSLAKTALHCAVSTNMFTQIKGQKVWTLIDPRYSKWLHVAYRNNMLYAASFVDYNKTNDEITQDGFPLYRYAPKIKATLNPGDGLLIPQWWWHSVDNIGFSVGVASRGVNYRNIFKGNTLFTLQALGSRKIWNFLKAIRKHGWGTDETSPETAYIEKKEPELTV